MALTKAAAETIKRVFADEFKKDVPYSVGSNDKVEKVVTVVKQIRMNELLNITKLAAQLAESGEKFDFLIKRSGEGVSITFF